MDDAWEMNPYAGSQNIHYVQEINDELWLMLQLEELDSREATLEISDMHLICRPKFQKGLSRVCRIAPFFRPNGSEFIHSKILYGEAGGRVPLTFAVSGGFLENEAATYASGGCFRVRMAGIGCRLKCANDYATLRIYKGPTLAMRRKECNDPSLPYVDFSLSETRALNTVEDDETPALAEFMSVVEHCETRQVLGKRLYKLRLRSNQPDSSAGFCWILFIPASSVEGHYVPHIGDTVRGHAMMYGIISGKAHETPDIVSDSYIADVNEDDGSDTPEEVSDRDCVTDDTDAWDNAPVITDRESEFLPRTSRDLFDSEDFGARLTEKTQKSLPKFMLYADFLRQSATATVDIPAPGRMILRDLMKQLDRVIPNKKSKNLFSKNAQTVGLRQIREDPATGTRCLWLCVQQHLYTLGALPCNLLVLTDCEYRLIGYTFHEGLTEALDGKRLDLFYHRWEAKENVHFDYIEKALTLLDTAKKSDFLIVSPFDYQSFVQLKCTKVPKTGERLFIIEWSVYDISWQFGIDNCPASRCKDIVRTYLTHGITAVQTMAEWEWVNI